MDPSAPLTVGVNTLLTSVATGSIAGAYGLFKGYNQVGPMITAAGINGGIAGATFFSFREYLISPLLLSALADTHYSLRIRELRERRREGGQAGDSGRLTWWDVRMNKVPDTAVSGAFTGGVLNAWKRGRPGIVPGIITAGLVCTAFQFAYNELEVARIKYVSKKLQPPQSPAPSIPAPSLPEPVQPLPLQEDEPRPSLSERVFTALGWHKVSDEQYLEKLKLKREMYLHRIAELQKEKEEEARRTESHEKS